MKLNKPLWQKFDARNPNVFKLAGKQQVEANKNLYNEWLAKHDFWYKQLTNEIYDKCLDLIDNAKSLAHSSSCLSCHIFFLYMFVCLFWFSMVVFY